MDNSKKHIILWFFLLTSLLLCSCSNSIESTDTQKNQNGLYGTWSKVEDFNFYNDSIGISNANKYFFPEQKIQINLSTIDFFNDCFFKYSRSYRLEAGSIMFNGEGCETELSTLQYIINNDTLILTDSISNSPEIHVQKYVKSDFRGPRLDSLRKTVIDIKCLENVWTIDSALSNIHSDHSDNILSELCLLGDKECPDIILQSKIGENEIYISTNEKEYKFEIVDFLILDRSILVLKQISPVRKNENYLFYE